MDSKNLNTKKTLILSLAFYVLTSFVAILLVLKYGDRIYKKFAYHFDYKYTYVKIVILGDSRVEFGNWNDGLHRDDVKNCGIGGITVSSYRNKLGDIYKYNPKYCIIQIGINDLRHSANIDTTINNFTQIIDSLLNHKIKPIITSVIFVRKENPQSMPSEIIVNSRTDSLNNSLIQLCTQKKIKYLDINIDLCENNILKAEFTHDGLHLNQDGYALIYEKIRRHLKFIKE